MSLARLIIVAGLVGLAACSTGPLDVCTPDPENPNQVNCPPPPATEQAVDSLGTL